MIKEMLSVLMDGLKDVDMLYDYYMDAENADEESFFKNHAKRRMEEVTADYSVIKNKMAQQQSEDIMKMFTEYIEYEINSLRNKLSGNI